ncbi:MAG: hypothetical protein JWO85_1155 [Candidatus Eremiobacteraeota bacterium]|nr:hypothetical protein [Candidatus Eremiobacteraeota bacterium]
MLAVAVLSTVLAVAGDPPLAGGEAGPRWFGLAFGTPVVTYRQRLGDPLQVEPSSPSEHRARFWVASGPPVFLIVSERRGAVTRLEAVTEAPLGGPVVSVEADPSGVVLGSTIEEVAQRHRAAQRSTDRDGAIHLIDRVDSTRGIVADYRFGNGRLVADAWFTPASMDAPQLPGAIPFAEPAGESEVTAILDVQTNDRDGVAWEYLYLRYHPCDAKTAWRVGTQSVRQSNARTYDVLEATCPSNGGKRAFFFDVTAFFGKL